MKTEAIYNIRGPSIEYRSSCRRPTVSRVNLVKAPLRTPPYSVTALGAAETLFEFQAKRANENIRAKLDTYNTVLEQ